jgi:NAD dependent epimerase/dehydratase family enzyme
MNSRILFRVPAALLRLIFGQRAKIFEYSLNVYPQRLQEANYQQINPFTYSSNFIIAGTAL